MGEISIFPNIWKSSGGEITSVDEFVNSVKFGVWKDQAEKIKNVENKEERQKEKKNIPYVTISGVFNHRKATEIVKHSGFICMDFDGVEDIGKSFESLKKDHFVYAMFRSISGRGLAVIVKIDPKKHLDAFLGLEVYFANKYEIYADRSCKDVSRARFASYDPDTFTNSESAKFTNYIPKSVKIAKSKLPNVITGSNDMDYIIGQINESSVDITKSDYLTWLDIGFAISKEFGESGRSYYHSVSYYSEKYDSERCDKQYDRCLKAGGQGVTFATFLYHCKAANVSIISKETKHIITVADMGRNGGRGLSEIVSTLKKVDGLDEEITEPIVKKVLAREGVGGDNKLSRLDSLEIFLNANYDLKRNAVTRYINSGDEEVTSEFFNSTWIKARKEVDDKTRFEEIDRLINSDFVPTYNPLIEFFERNAFNTPSGLIDQLADCIESPNEYKSLFLKKWLVGLIASIHGEHSPLLLALTGGQRTGKTEFFRRLLPEELQVYYAESKLDAGKDDEILMTQKILILDDEFGGKSKTEAKKLKEITSKDWFTLREPYGKRNVRLKRLAVLAGTSNDEKILNDPTGNRRIIPISVKSINHSLYNSIDKKLLLMEAYHLWKEGYKWQTSKDDVDVLNSGSAQFEQVVLEKEMILRYFKPAEMASDMDVTGIEYLQASEIKSIIEKESQQRMNLFKIVAELKRLKFEEESKEISGCTARVYQVIRINEDFQELRSEDNNKMSAGF